MDWNGELAKEKAGLLWAAGALTAFGVTVFERIVIEGASMDNAPIGVFCVVIGAMLYWLREQRKNPPAAVAAK